MQESTRACYFSFKEFWLSTPTVSILTSIDFEALYSSKSNATVWTIHDMFCVRLLPNQMAYKRIIALFVQNVVPLIVCFVPQRSKTTSND